MDNINEMYTDLESYPITGYDPRSYGRMVNIPLISEVLPGLWQGGCIQGVTLPHDFDLVISLYKWEQYDLGSNTERVEVLMYDSHDVPMVDDVVDQAYSAWKSGKKTLIHCQAGLNRSGLVSAKVLMKDGMTAQEAINHLRQSRSELVLFNKTFEDHLLSLDKELND